MITTHYPSGAVANAGITVRANSRNLAMIAGTKGSILMDHDWHRPSTFTIFRDGQAPEAFDLSHEGIGYQYEIMEVGTCIREGKTEHPVMPLDETLQIQGIMEKVIRDWGVTYPTDRS
jgi:predicted dehydrogenase